MKKAIVIGASSGIGRELAKQLSENGVVLGLAARREELLTKLRNELPNLSHIKKIDVADVEQANMLLKELIRELGQVDAVFICSGVGYTESGIDWHKQKETIDVNVSGFAACSNVFLEHFLHNGRGHLIALSSVAALRASGSAVAYSASKAFVSHYVKGLRRKVKSAGADIAITEIQPGFVNTALAKAENLFWAASPEKAAAQILKAVQKKEKTRLYYKKMADDRMDLEMPSLKACLKRQGDAVCRRSTLFQNTKNRC